MSRLNRQWLLRERPSGAIDESVFEYREQKMPEPNLQTGQTLVRNLWFSFDPAMRNWMDDRPGYMPPQQLNEPMRASALGEVIASANDDLPVGALVQGLFGWQDYTLSDPASLTAAVAVADAQAPPEMLLNVLGGTGVTAWVGISRVARDCKDAVVAVSAAAGATGSVAAQLARARGAKSVIGIAGGEEKCRWLREDCKLNGAIDYRAEDVAARLAELCPDGIDLFFDNVGGEILQAALANMTQGGQIVLCGQIANYQSGVGPNNLIEIVFRRLSVEGFLMIDHLRHMAEAAAELARLVEAGDIVWRSDVQHGFKNIPGVFLRLFSGANFGKQLLKNDIA